MKSGTLSALAACCLGSTCWLWSIVAEPGTQFWAALGAGSAAWVTIQLTVAAVRADQRERIAAQIRGDR